MKEERNRLESRTAPAREERTPDAVLEVLREALGAPEDPRSWFPAKRTSAKTIARAVRWNAFVLGRT